MRKFLLGAALILLTVTSCDKNKDFSEAVILDSGDITADGCGYLLRFEDGREEKPEHLPSAFRHNGLQVLVKYHSTGILDTCEFTAPRKFFDLVQIDDIRRKID